MMPRWPLLGIDGVIDDDDQQHSNTLGAAPPLPFRLDFVFTEVSPQSLSFLRDRFVFKDATQRERRRRKMKMGRDRRVPHEVGVRSEGMGTGSTSRGAGERGMAQREGHQDDNADTRRQRHSVAPSAAQKDLSPEARLAVYERYREFSIESRKAALLLPWLWEEGIFHKNATNNAAAAPTPTRGAADDNSTDFNLLLFNRRALETLERRATAAADTLRRALRSASGEGSSHEAGEGVGQTTAKRVVANTNSSGGGKNESILRALLPILSKSNAIADAIDDGDGQSDSDHEDVDNTEDDNRFRNFNEIKYALRSLYRYVIRPAMRMPKLNGTKRGQGAAQPSSHHQATALPPSALGNIYIIVAHKDQVPAWLKHGMDSLGPAAGDIGGADADMKANISSALAKRIVIIEHSALFPSAAPPQYSSLPTFNSRAIESVIHRIPNLSRHYVYMNNDFVLARPVSFFDFFQPVVVERSGWGGGGAEGRGPVVRWLPVIRTNTVVATEASKDPRGGDEKAEEGGADRWKGALAAKEVLTIQLLSKLSAVAARNNLTSSHQFPHSSPFPLFPFVLSMSHIPQVYDKLIVMHLVTGASPSSLSSSSLPSPHSSSPPSSEYLMDKLMRHTRTLRLRLETNLALMHAYTHFSAVWRGGHWGGGGNFDDGGGGGVGRKAALRILEAMLAAGHKAEIALVTDNGTAREAAGHHTRRVGRLGLPSAVKDRGGPTRRRSLWDYFLLLAQRQRDVDGNGIIAAGELREKEKQETSGRSVAVRMRTILDWLDADGALLSQASLTPPPSPPPSLSLPSSFAPWQHDLYQLLRQPIQLMGRSGAVFFGMGKSLESLAAHRAEVWRRKQHIGRRLGDISNDRGHPPRVENETHKANMGGNPNKGVAPKEGEEAYDVSPQRSAPFLLPSRLLFVTENDDMPVGSKFGMQSSLASLPSLPSLSLSSPLATSAVPDAAIRRVCTRWSFAVWRAAVRQWLDAEGVGGIASVVGARSNGDASLSFIRTDETLFAESSASPSSSPMAFFRRSKALQHQMVAVHIGGEHIGSQHQQQHHTVRMMEVLFGDRVEEQLVAFNDGKFMPPPPLPAQPIIIDNDTNEKKDEKGFASSSSSSFTNSSALPTSQLISFLASHIAGVIRTACDLYLLETEWVLPLEEAAAEATRVHASRVASDANSSQATRGGDAKWDCRVHYDRNAITTVSQRSSALNITSSSTSPSPSLLSSPLPFDAFAGCPLPPLERRINGIKAVDHKARRQSRRNHHRDGSGGNKRPRWGPTEASVDRRLPESRDNGDGIGGVLRINLARDRLNAPSSSSSATALWCLNATRPLAARNTDRQQHAANDDADDHGSSSTTVYGAWMYVDIARIAAGDYDCEESVDEEGGGRGDVPPWEK